MMDPVLKARWVGDLRSGVYQQTTDYLRNPDGSGYCCLGVLCLTAGAEFKNYDNLGDEDNAGGEFWENRPVLNGDNLAGRDDEELNPVWMRQIGMSAEDMRILIGKNDRSVPFAEIADWIEENL